MDEDAPFSTPSGFSIAMAPGSGLASAYTSTSPAPATAPTAAPVAAATGKAPTAPPAAAVSSPDTAPVRPVAGRHCVHVFAHLIIGVHACEQARKLTPAEQEEYEQFRRHQSGSGKLLRGELTQRHTLPGRGDG